MLATLISRGNILQKPDDSNAKLATVFIQQITIPSVHMQVFEHVLKDYHRILSAVLAGQQWHTLSREFDLESNEVTRQIRNDR